ncbi:MAG: tetratricopeptide repeat-containing sulfotransferase family protein [Halothiobacillaceae bacterium]
MSVQTPTLPPELDALMHQAVALHQQGQVAQALPLYQQALALAPGVAQIHHLLGLALLSLGQADQAASSFDAALRLDPNHIEALLQRGLLHYTAQRDAAAVADFQRVVALAPNDPRGWVNLSAAALLAENLSLARQAAERAVQLAPNQADGWNNLSQIEQRSGAFARAEAACRRALQFNPQHAGIWLNLGDALRAQGRLAEAEPAYRQSLERDPTLVNAWTNYGNLLGQLHRVAEARAAFERALELDPAAAEPLVNLAGLLIAEGNEHAAIDRLRPLVEAGRATAEQVAIYAFALRAAGRLDEAQQLLLSRPSDIAGQRATVQALGQLALARKALMPQAIDAAERWLREQAPLAPVAERIDMHILLAQLADKAGEPARAFAQATAGKRLKAQRSDPAAEQALAAALEQAFTPERLRRPPYGLPHERRPVFIVGLPRSGTSLLEQMLAAHPQVHAAGEVEELGQISTELAPANELDWPARAAALDAASLEPLARRYLHVLGAEALAASRITDKMPHNFVRLGFIHLLFPQARILHIERDPRDVALSILFHHFAGHHPYANHLEDIAHHILFYRRCMAHWRAALPPGTLYELHYEQLVTDPQPHLRAVLDFLGLPWDDNVLAPERQARTVLTSSRFQVQEPVHRRAVGRWQAYARQLEPLIRLLRAHHALPA